MSVKSPAKLNFKSSLSRINKKYIIPATRSDATYVVENLDRFNIPLIDSSAIDSSRGIIIEKPFPKSPPDPTAILD